MVAGLNDCNVRTPVGISIPEVTLSEKSKLPQLLCSSCLRPLHLVLPDESLMGCLLFLDSSMQLWAFVSTIFQTSRLAHCKQRNPLEINNPCAGSSSDYNSGCQVMNGEAYLSHCLILILCCWFSGLHATDRQLCLRGD